MTAGRPATPGQLALDFGAAAIPAGREPWEPVGPSAGDPDSFPDAEPRLSARRIARLLQRPEPTDEQLRVIEAPVQPLLVVAGAGSGKTETMAGRVVWLVANGFVRPEQVLGLTFTRKAAAELAERVRLRLRALARHRLIEDVEPVEVATYHSYAAGLLGDHGLRIGIDTGARLLGEAAAWQLVDDLVQGWDGAMTGVNLAPATVVSAVLELAGECSEHLLSPDDVRSELEQVVERARRLPEDLGGETPGRVRRSVEDRLGRLSLRAELLPIVDAYLRRKRELDVIDYGDQVALAARLAREVPAIGAAERARYRVVLLDEYQDTSHAQLVLLRAVYGGGHPVTAVGDPHQSIYGWRGASAGNLQRFGHHFPDREGEPAAVAYLSTSWRNDRAVLRTANVLSEPLRTQAAPDAAVDGGAALVHVPPLDAREQACAGAVRLEWHTDVDAEARSVAEFARGIWDQDSGRIATRAPSATRRSIAVLCRKRSQFPLLEAALRLSDLPVEVVGLGGLLHVPEVADLRAALEVVQDPTRGDSLMRLLTGVGWQIGPRDLDALGMWAGRLARRATRRRPAGQDDAPAQPLAVADAVDERSLVEALDDLPPHQWQGPEGQELSPEGRDRLARLAGVLRGLRSRTALPLPDLVLEVQTALLLDVEVAARPGVHPVSARAHLDAFVDVAAGFAESAEHPTLGGFLSWLSAAETTERGLEPGTTDVRSDAVQILTVHAAKGLEWDVVIVPGLIEGGFPTAGAKRRGGSGSGSDGDAPPPDMSYGWLGEHGAVPYSVRGDADDLPHWRIESAGTQPGLETELNHFRMACGDREIAEERRLAYVAVTRARSLLLLTGAAWGDGKKPRLPSRFLVEVAEQPVDGVERGEWDSAAADHPSNPRDALSRTAAWPLDRPLGSRQEAVEEAAARVRADMAQLAASVRASDAWQPEAGSREEGWAKEVGLLLAERDAAQKRELIAVLPPHLSASRVVALAADPQALAARLRRPMPEAPSPQARRGSAFHAWLERRFGAAALVDIDELPGASDDAAAEEDLSSLQATFLASEWGHRTPEAVEVAVETPVAGVVLRGRIDAVFGRDDGGWDVVDWKTGAPPPPQAAQARSVQLAVYRLAWARLHGVPLDRVSAAFFYAATGDTVRPVDLLDQAALTALLTLPN